MTKQIQCGDVVPGCSFKAEAASEQELLQKVAAHAKQAHGIDEVTPEVLAKVKSAIRER
jgi:predicted small metal-binding protein